MGVANSAWDLKKGTDAEGDRFVLYPLVDKDSGRVLATISGPAFPDAYSYTAYFDIDLPDAVLDTDGRFIFLDLDLAKAFVIKHLTRAEKYAAGIKGVQESLA